MDNLFNNAMDEVNYGGAKIKVIGAGGGGGNAVKHMVESGVNGVDFSIVNTDIQAIKDSVVPEKIQIGVKLTRGLGAGANPEIGRRAAEESIDEIKQSLRGYDLVFIAAGMGGGTGTGSASVLAQTAREMGILTVGVVTLPFGFEGKPRMRKALEGKRMLAEQVDTIITIPNDRLVKLMEQQGKKVTMINALKEADNVLRHAVQGITDLIKKPGVINLDFADIKTIMSIRGSSLMGIGTGKGVDRIREATESAMKNPLLEHDITGAKGLIFNITGNEDLGFEDFIAANSIISDLVADECEYIVGTALDENMAPDTVQVTVVATGFDDETIERQKEINQLISGNRPEYSRPNQTASVERTRVNEPARAERTSDKKNEESESFVTREMNSIYESLNMPEFMKNLKRN